MSRFSPFLFTLLPFSPFGWVWNQIRVEVAVERRKRSRISGREPEADVAIGPDHDHAAGRDAGADGIEVRVVRDLHELGPAATQPCERRGIFDGPKDEHTVCCPTEPRPVRVALAGIWPRDACTSS